jgi:DNA repair protein RadC
MKVLRERLRRYGPQTLLTEELLAIILSTGSARADVLALAEKLLTRYGGLERLMQADRGELRHENGLSDARVALLLVALELGKRLNLPQTEEKYQISSPADAARLVMPEMAYLEYEQLRVIVLDTKNQVVCTMALYRGTAHSLVLRAAEIFRPAIVRNCSGIIICHNHPSAGGSPEPTPEDIEVTNQLVAAGKVLDIDVVDHLIIGGHQFVSLKERLRW